MAVVLATKSAVSPAVVSAQMDSLLDLYIQVQDILPAALDQQLLLLAEMRMNCSFDEFQKVVDHVRAMAFALGYALMEIK